MEEMIADLRQVVREAGGLDRLFSSSENPQVPLVQPRRQGLLLTTGRWIQARVALIMFVVLAIALVALAITLYYSSHRSEPHPLAPIKSIAVLPFKPLLAEGRDEALEMGMADTLISKLSNIREVSVRPLSAVRKYTSLDQDAAAARNYFRTMTTSAGSGPL